MRLVLAVILCLVSVAGCSAAPAPPVLHPEYRYVASYAPGPFTAGAAFHVVWIPELVRTDSAELYDVRLCIGVFGSFESQTVLQPARSCSLEFSGRGPTAVTLSLPTSSYRGSTAFMTFAKLQSMEWSQRTVRHRREESSKSEGPSSCRALVLPLAHSS
jgi:hypothetical protein